MKNQRVKKVFRSRISVLLLGLVLAIFIPKIISTIKYMINSGSFTLGGIFVFGAVMFLLCGFRYVISGDKLYGKIFWIIPSGSVKISDIVSLERSYNPLSSAAASLKRLAVNSSGGSVFSYILISPVREQEFIEELKSINSNIKVNVPVKKGILRIWDWDI